MTPDSAMKRFLLAVGLLMIGDAAVAVGFDHVAWDHLLAKHVVVLRHGQATAVDYAGFAADRAALEAYLAGTSAVSRASFDAWAKPDHLAFLIKVYNARTVELVLTGYPGIHSIKDLGSVFRSPWKRRFIPLLEEVRSLDDIEHGLIRAKGRYHEPRIHFAVNCASIGCPALRLQAYAGDRLAEQLDEATRIFLSDRSRNRLEGNTLKVSSLFKWYREDFTRGWGGYEVLWQFFAAYQGALGLADGDIQRLQSGAITIEFLDYDWRLNDANHHLP